MMSPFAPQPSYGDPDGEYQPIPVGHLFPHAPGDFQVFLRHGDNHTLFARVGEAVTGLRREMLVDYGVRTVYIHRDERERYRDYMRRHLPGALLGTHLPIAEKAAVFYHNCCDIVRDLIRERLPQAVSDVHGRLFVGYARDSVAFLCSEAGLARMGALMAHDYDVYSHGVHVFVYTVYLLRSLGLPQGTIVQAGLGALLHDAGKEGVDAAILTKPGRLSREEFDIVREHPVLGARLCRNLGLSRLAQECILMHHEKLDGRGYPAGLSGEAIPVHARAVSLADVYDALTSRRCYADAVTPFEALRIMRHEMAGAFDLDLYKRFVMLLSGAALV
ncbi:MAG: HD-GYP domain-containing protein [Solidesulfovibrio magneticus str. Maddingley MBC34]|uniref:HD-GYP domain-containing protein n=1 Tax=Solidesulfovibrio magneticus str. Maddingley MBC34 TaxID=1206767 RepID=K6GVC8_9BACT|nr:MAG: HD-GYP domain-containing protein [Solidesulfovibrio magneticus str. Maddingley MBC34]